MLFLPVTLTLVVIIGSVTGQRSSPQFSFPPPQNQPAPNFPDTFSNADLSLLSPSSQSQSVGQQSSFSLNQPSSQGQQQQSSSSSSTSSLSPSLDQPTIQLSRPSLSLASLGQSSNLIGSSSPSQLSPSSSSSSSSSTASRSIVTAPASGPQSLVSFALQASQPQQHHSSRHPQHSSSSTSTSSSSSSGSGSSSSSHHHHSTPTSSSGSNNHGQTSSASRNHQQLPSGASLPNNITPNQQAIIDSARKAEATSASLAAASSGQTYHCPESFGFFRHHKSCDKYWACENGTATLKLCGNGLNFDDSDSKRENCAYPFSVDCGDRTDTEPPISTPHCPRLYGLFPETNNCRVFYSCWNGEASRYECPPGLAYDNEQRVCVWADLVDRCDQSEVSDGFVCPDPSEVDQPGHYTRHAHPTDCRKFYVCIEGVARPYGCSFGSVFNVDSLQCDEPENVSGCEKYYGDIDPKTAKKLARENANANANQISLDQRQPTAASRSVSTSSPLQGAH